MDLLLLLLQMDLHAVQLNEPPEFFINNFCHIQPQQFLHRRKNNRAQRAEEFLGKKLRLKKCRLTQDQCSQLSSCCWYCRSFIVEALLYGSCVKLFVCSPCACEGFLGWERKTSQSPMTCRIGEQLNMNFILC